MNKPFLLPCVIMLALAGGLRAADKTYIGTNGGAWEAAGNWDPAGAPESGDTALISNKAVSIAAEAEAAGVTLLGPSSCLFVAGRGTNVLSQTALDFSRTNPVGLRVNGDLLLAGSLSVGGATQQCRSYLTVGGNLTLTGTAALVVYAGPSNDFDTLVTGGARVSVSGLTTVASGSWIYPDCHLFTGLPVVFDLLDLSIAANGGFNATQRGYGWMNNGSSSVIPGGMFSALNSGTYYYTAGFGRGLGYQKGGGYGGRGGDSDATYGNTYGFSNAPLYAGSPNGVYSASAWRRGGGAIRIKARQVRLDGQLRADAGLQSMYGGSAGGGIWVLCDSISYGPMAVLNAAGGTNGAYNSAGGGGRISIGLMLSPEQIAALEEGTNPEGLEYGPLLQVPAIVTGGRGERIGETVWRTGSNGTCTYVAAPGAEKFLVVSAFPAPMGDPDPAYGTHTISNGASVACSAQSEPQVLPGSGNRIRYSCIGYSVSNAYSALDSGSATAATVTLTQNLFLNWNWGSRETLLTAEAGPYGSLRIGGDAVETHSQWVPDGTASAPVEAVPDAGYEFLCWVGEVPFLQATNPVLQYAGDKPRAVKALFRLAEGPTARFWNGPTNAAGDWMNTNLWLPAGNVPGRFDTVTVARGACYVTSFVEVASLTLASNAILRVSSRSDYYYNYYFSVDSTRHVAYTGAVADDIALIVHGPFTLADTAQAAVGGPSQPYWSRLIVEGNLALTGSNKLLVAAGPTNHLFSFRTGGGQVRVEGDITVASNSWIYPLCEPYSGAPVRFDAEGVFIDAGGGIDATKGGFGRVPSRSPTTLGPGQGLSYTIGAGHGGRGGGYSAIYGLAYGWSNAPVMPGSCNGDYWPSLNGGGAIRVHANRVTVEGTLKADADPASWAGGPSGGGIWVTAAKTLAIGPKALLSARGGPSNYSSRGGGGRIAFGLRLPSADLDALAETGQPVTPKVQWVSATEVSNRYPGASWTLDQLPGGTGTFIAEHGTRTFLEGRSLPGTVVVLR